MNNLNPSSPSPLFSGNKYHDNQIAQLLPDNSYSPTLRVISSSSPHSFVIHDQIQDQEEASLAYDNNGSSSSSTLSYQGTSKNGINVGLGLTMWKEDHHQEPINNSDNIKNCITTATTTKWMSSKMRLMQKMKNPEYPLSPNKKRLRTSDEENQKLIFRRYSSSSSAETDSSSNNINCSYQNNSPIRVCSDCNTTKTPLWRSGPKGPKSLCNACGIRQRKARRAMAEAASNGTVVPAPYNLMKIKEKKGIASPSSMGKIDGHSSHFKKRFEQAKDRSNADSIAKKMGTSSTSSKLEDFLIKLSENLAFHRVFPQDEKDAAILLMALSSGLVHG